ncbi:adenylate/guanylate cyclase domain-containing protein [Silvimonas iriomotensis]|uniref:Adenylate/guanylate cyclase domain-containing protein n=2 Tax=Silvimonas iriomotensis TaxID=449662 RepID=A0ABQ2PDP9_9NEIS|nr:adenylate/guanylate cyclase domain-containing protein [Silvimonas iriomotensis]
MLLLIAADYGGLHLTRAVDHAVNDRLLARHAQTRAPSPDIVLVDIDQKSLTALADEAGAWPWPRALHAEMLDALARQQPKAIIFDLMFNEPDTFRADSDKLFQDTARQHASLLYLPSVQLADGTGPLLRNLPPSLGLQRSARAVPDASLPLLLPWVLPQDVWRGGLINFLADADGIGRRYRLAQETQGWRILSLPAQLAADQHWPLPDSKAITLNWTAPHPRVSYSDLYLDFNSEHPKRAANEFAGKIVIIGTAAPGLQDLRPTPLSATWPGVEILATAIDNLQHQDWLRQPHRAGFGLWAAVLCALLVTGFARSLNTLGLGAALLLASAASMATGWLALGRHWLLPLYAPLLFAWVCYILCALQAWLAEKRRRERTMQMFGRFLDPRVASTLVESGDMAATMQPQTRNITVLFSDIRGFTSLSESRPPEYIVALLNQYFTRQVEVVFKHGGTLDKFIGDCIMAFWGAPADDPQHARHAVAAALDMARELEAFRQSLTDLDVEFDVGIGIHTGPAVVGFIGAPSRLDYTVIGDTVNLASRIEGQTKGIARVLVSEATRQACGPDCEFDFVDHGQHQVKGRDKPVQLFAPQEKQ